MLICVIAVLVMPVFEGTLLHASNKVASLSVTVQFSVSLGHLPRKRTRQDDAYCRERAIQGCL